MTKLQQNINELELLKKAIPIFKGTFENIYNKLMESKSRLITLELQYKNNQCFGYNIKEEDLKRGSQLQINFIYI